MIEDLFQSSTSVSLLVAIVGLLVLHRFYSSFSSQDNKREPPGPNPLPLLGNLLHVDLKRLDSSLLNVYNVFPWLGPFLKNWRALMRNGEDYRNDVRHLIAELKETLNPEMCRCFVDAFLTHKMNLEESEIKDSHYHDDNLLYSVMNLFAAGTDTTAYTLKWCLLFIAKYLHFQDWVQEELDRVFGSRQVGVEDRKNLPYTDAVIHESQRFADIG